jgi:MFS family permease
VGTAAPTRVTAREVLGVRDVRGLLLSDGLSVVGDQVARLAVALLVLERTGSALAASATYATAYLTWLLGGPALSGLPDRYPRRTVMVASDLARMALVACLALPGLPLVVVFGVLVLVGLLAPPAEAARSALLADVLTGEPYVVANAISNAVSQAGQVVGFLAGGALVGILGVEGALLADAATFAVSALLLLALVQDRRPQARAGGAPATSRSELVAGARLVLRTRRLRTLLAWGLLSAASVIAAEGLAVPISDALGGGPLMAGVLTAAVPAGFLIGSWALLRVGSERREALFPYLVTLSCLPLLATPFVDEPALLAALWVLAGTGNALQLVANSAFVQAVPAHLRGRAFGVAATALMALQGVALLAAGALAEVTEPRLPIAALALLCLLLVPVLTPPSQVFAILRRSEAR